MGALCVVWVMQGRGGGGWWVTSLRRMQSPKFFGISFPPQKSPSSREQRESESDMENHMGGTRAEKD